MRRKIQIAVSIQNWAPNCEYNTTKGKKRRSSEAKVNRIRESKRSCNSTEPRPNMLGLDNLL